MDIIGKRFGRLAGFRQCIRQTGETQKAQYIGIEAERIIYKGFLQSYRKWELKNSEDPEWGKTHPFIFEVMQDSQRNLIIKRNSMDQ